MFVAAIRREVCSVFTNNPTMFRLQPTVAENLRSTAQQLLLCVLCYPLEFFTFWQKRGSPCCIYVYSLQFLMRCVLHNRTWTFCHQRWTRPMLPTLVIYLDVLVELFLHCTVHLTENKWRRPLSRLQLKRRRLCVYFMLLSLDYKKTGCCNLV